MSPITIQPLISLPHKPYDILLCAVGFERRARNVAEKLAIRGKSQYAIGFPDRQVLSYLENRDWFQQRNFTYAAISDKEFEAFIRETISSCSPDTEELRIAVDISSFNRTRLAAIVECATESRLPSIAIVLHFFYSLGAFSSPSPATVCRNQHVGPVTPAFAGWSEEPMLPPCVILGLGYEEGKALGAIDHLEVSNALAFVPTSPIEEYLAEVLNANSTLLDALGPGHAMRYRVHEPTRTFEMLESAVSGLLPKFNPVLLPFGPKIFFVISLLVAIVHPRCSVWRVSGGESEPPVDRLPSSHIISLEVRFPSSC
jgi:hypothetical protein